MADQQSTRPPYDLMLSRPGWGRQTIKRLSVNRAVALLQAKRTEQRARARCVAGAIDTLQNYARARRDFIGMARCCPVIAGLFIYSGEPLTGLLWLTNSPILLLHLRKAHQAKEQAQSLLEAQSASLYCR